LPAVYTASDLFVLLPTPDEEDGEVEGFGMVYLEAAARGVPAVAWRTGGVAEAVVDGVTGLVVPAGDADGAGDAIERLLADSALRREMADAAKAHAGAVAEQARVSLRRLDGGHG
jgi:glycosyltransferase involved in cell wall biosynthesis